MRNVLTRPLYSKRRFFGTILGLLAFVTIIGGRTSHPHHAAPVPAAVVVTTTSTTSSGVYVAPEATTTPVSEYDGPGPNG